jgi:hypothetical protein
MRRILFGLAAAMLVGGAVAADRLSDKPGAFNLSAAAPSHNSSPWTGSLESPAPVEVTTIPEPPVPSSLPVTTPAVSAPRAPRVPPVTVAPRAAKAPIPRVAKAVVAPAFRARSDCRGIFSLDLATGRARMLAQTGRNIGGPRWAPDGSMLVFEVDGRMETMAADGAGRHAVGAIGRNPTILPDNHTAVSTYYGADPAAGRDEYSTVVTDLNTGEHRFVVGERRNHVMVPSPDGRHVAYGASKDNGLRVIGMDGANDRGVPAFSYAPPVWSPDGSLLTFRNPDGDGVVAFDVDAGTSYVLYAGVVDNSRYVFAGRDTLLIERGGNVIAINLTSGLPGTAFTNASMPQWDGARSKVLFRRPANSSTASVIEANPDGTGEHAILEDAETQIGRVEPSPIGGPMLFHCSLINS